ncbi:pyridoxamine 5'-phosphate oxidase [Streptomyces caatingaensis]|uniref:Pyridoxamine 5'-phosphate oxidase n=1 Tax=Streptomyces caatingaensis TaxID=1678637 RepID=A0A0K9XF69_9ACTN|nr:pyridoxamine 5'-phosphate oxidase [Streptomyces caatingaensis]KNB52045.1 pyridoxamine 5'-phosphate oxidase [Streptomyces caatingaensis]
MDPEIRAALDAHSTLTLAYVDADGPQACAVFYAVFCPVTEASGATGAPALVFVTSPTTRHGRALLPGDVPVAFTAQRDGQEWTGLTGVQGRGLCRRLAGAERAAALEAYRERFPYVEHDERLRQAMERADLWELRPRWLRLVDNGRGFGHRTEWSEGG